MVNRIKNMIEESLKLRGLLTRKLKPKQLAEIGIRLKAITWRIKHFGQKHTIVKVDVTYTRNNSLKKIQVYFTDVEEFEAIDYVRYILDGTIIEITAQKVPTARPIKL